MQESTVESASSPVSGIEFIPEGRNVGAAGAFRWFYASFGILIRAPLYWVGYVLFAIALSFLLTIACMFGDIAIYLLVSQVIPDFNLPILELEGVINLGFSPESVAQILAFFMRFVSYWLLCAYVMKGAMFSAKQLKAGNHISFKQIFSVGRGFLRLAPWWMVLGGGLIVALSTPFTIMALVYTSPVIAVGLAVLIAFLAVAASLYSPGLLAFQGCGAARSLGTSLAVSLINFFPSLILFGVAFGVVSGLLLLFDAMRWLSVLPFCLVGATALFSIVTYVSYEDIFFRASPST